MSCASGCYETQVNGCSDITLKAQLDAETAYYIQVNKASNSYVYQRQVTSGTDGNLMITKVNFPAGYFSRGYFNLQVRKASDYTIQPLVFNSISYNCVLFQVVNTDIEEGDISPISTIQ